MPSQGSKAIIPRVWTGEVRSTMPYAIASVLSKELLLSKQELITGATGTSTPTTRILAIGTINPGVDQAKVLEILPNEVRETVNLYLDGKIDQWYSLQDRRGVVFILNVTDPTVAHEMLEKLPLGQTHLMSFELIPIGPLNPLRKLQGMATKQ